MQDLQQLLNRLHVSATQVTEERARAAALFLSIGDGAIATDAEGRIKQINQVALDILGYSEEEIVGKWFPKIIIAQNENGEPIHPLQLPITRTILTGKPITERTHYLTKDGKSLPVTVTVSPIIQNNKPIGAVEVFRDITQEYEIDKMKSEFISVASHQLRTPLSAIKTYSHLLAGDYSGKLNQRQQHFINTVLDSVERMNEIINILLNVSKIETGKIELLLKKTDIHKLAAAVIHELHPEATSKQISLKLSGASPVAQIDRVLTTEVLTNLVSNAVKYTPDKGRVRVNISESKNKLLFSVSDTGYGIPANVQERIFSKFFRADNIKKIDTTGTGLGLYMAKKVVEAMGGTIWFETTENKGTTFFFTLPKTNN